MREGDELESTKLFPAVPTSDFRSSYYRESYLFPYNPDPLCAGNNYSIYDEMLKDDQIKVCLAIKKDMVVNSGFEIVTEKAGENNGKEPDEQGQADKDEVKEFFERDFQEMQDDPTTDMSFEDVLRQILSSYGYGFSVSEVLAKFEEGQYHIKSIRTRAPHTFQFKLDDKGNLEELLQHGANGPKKLNPEYFLHHVYQPDFGNPYGNSDLQAAYAAWKAKKYFVRMFCVYAERYAQPTVVARYKQGTQTEEINRIHEMVKSLQNSTSLTLPDDVVLDYMQSARDASEAYIKGIHLFNMTIGRSLLVPDLAGVSGEKTSGGSYALGEQQFNMFQSTIQKDRASLERKINLRIMRPFLDLNFGKDVKATFRLKPWTQDDTKENLKLWLEACKASVYKPGLEEIDHFRGLIKFPKPPLEIQAPVQEDGPNGPEDGEGGGEGKGPGATSGDSPKGGANGAPPAKPNPAVSGVPAPRELKPKPAERERKFSADAPKLLVYRDLYAYERKVDFAAVKRSLDFSERSMTKSIGDVAKKMRREFLDQIKAKGILAKFKPEALNSIEPKYAKEMNQTVKGEFRGLFREALEEARLEIIPAGTKKYVAADILPEEFERILEAEAFTIVGNYKTEMTKRAVQRLTQGIKAGMSEGQLTALLSEDLDNQTERWLNTLARTKTTEIYNGARKTMWETDPVIKNIVEAYSFSAILDERTTDVCRYMDGKIFEKGSFIDKATPPLHFGCRSILVAITKFEDYQVDKAPTLESLVERGGNLIPASKG